MDMIASIQRILSDGGHLQRPTTGDGRWCVLDTYSGFDNLEVICEGGRVEFRLPLFDLHTDDDHALLRFLQERNAADTEHGTYSVEGTQVVLHDSMEPDPQDLRQRFFAVLESLLLSAREYRRWWSRSREELTSERQVLADLQVRTIDTPEGEPFAPYTVDPQGLEEGLAPRPMSLDDAAHDAIVARVYDAYAAATEDAQEAPAHYQCGALWADTLANRRPFPDLLRRGDLPGLAETLRHFLRNQGSMGIWTFSLFSEVKPSGQRKRKWLVEALVDDLLLWHELTGRSDVSVLTPPKVGDPWGYLLGDTLVTPVSPRYHYYAHQAEQLLEHAERSRVVEIGGGVGGFGYYLLRGARSSYVALDLPEILLMSSYYLLCAFPEKRFFLYGEGPIEDLPGALEEYDGVMLPNFVFPQLPPSCADLVFQAGGLAEMDWETICEYVGQMSRVSRQFIYNENHATDASFDAKRAWVSADRFQDFGPEFEQVFNRPTRWGGGMGFREYLYRREKP